MSNLEKNLINFINRSIAPNSAGNISYYAAGSSSALNLLTRHPHASRDAVLTFYAGIVDLNMDLTLRGNEAASLRQASKLLNELDNNLSGLVTATTARDGSSSWAHTIANWSFNVLGDLSSKFANRVSGSSGMQLHDALQVWLAYKPTRTIIDLISLCLRSLSDSPDKTEQCISTLLDMHVKHNTHYDWVVAHVGSCFPEVIINRVLTVGLKDYCQSVIAQVSKDKKVNLSKVPKLNSVVGILEHLALSHAREIKKALQDMISDCLQKSPIKTKTDQQIGVVPYVLNIASLSTPMSNMLTSDVYARVAEDDTSVEQVAELYETWEKNFFSEEASLGTLVIHLILKSEENSKDIIQLLFDFGSARSADVRHGARHLMDIILSDTQVMVHKSRKFSSEEVPLLRTLDPEFFMRKYLLSSDAFERRSCLMLLNLLSLKRGQNVAVTVIKYCLTAASDLEELAVLLEFVRDIEIWFPNAVSMSVTQCMRSSHLDAESLLRNLGHILHYQSQSSEDQKIGSFSNFAQTVAQNQGDLFRHLGQLELLPHVLKIFHFVPLSPQHCSVSTLHRAVHRFTQAVFDLLLDQNSFPKAEKMHLIGECVKTLYDVSEYSTGLPIVLRTLVEGGINSIYAKKLFGATSTMIREDDNANGPNPGCGKAGVSLLEENLKFGSMPTHPLGTLTVFHAGIIGDGKKRHDTGTNLDRHAVDFNRFTFVSILFKICHQGTRERTKEACKLLAMIVVELVSPNVMFNVLPWPEEEFTKILSGLAEARPALCYCSVLLRGLLAVQMNFWQASVAVKASDNPKHLQKTQRILELMSLGQYLPHPLNAVSEVLYAFHAYHVYCVLVDIWNYMKDNVPSPMAFATNSEGHLNRGFEPYKNYKNYCERLRLIMIHHIDVLPKEFKRFFVDVAIKQEQDLKLAMEY